MWQESPYSVFVSTYPTLLSQIVDIIRTAYVDVADEPYHDVFARQAYPHKYYEKISRGIKALKVEGLTCRPVLNASKNHSHIEISDKRFTITVHYTIFATENPRPAVYRDNLIIGGQTSLFSAICPDPRERRAYFAITHQPESIGECKLKDVRLILLSEGIWPEAINMSIMEAPVEEIVPQEPSRREEIAASGMPKLR